MSLVRAALIASALGCAGPAPAFAKSIDAVELPTVALDSCSWNRPGVNPFMGDVVAAVDRYTDIPADVRARLKARMAKREYDDLVSIRRDSIEGRAGRQYGSTIRDMHFGTHQICRSVTRAAWTAGMKERGLVYCEGGQCILVPTVCRNVSRISRRAVDADHAEAPEAVDEPVPPAAVLAEPAGDPTATPLAHDESPSFVRPQAWDGAPPYGGGPGTAGPGEGWGGDAPPGGFPGPGGGPIVVTASTPPGGIDGPPSVPPPAQPVPEPATWALMLGGLAALALARRRGALRTRASAADSAR